MIKNWSLFIQIPMQFLRGVLSGSLFGNRAKTSPSVYPCSYFRTVVVTWAFCRFSHSRELHLLPGLTVLVLPAGSKQTEDAGEDILIEAKKERNQVSSHTAFPS